MSTLVPVFSRGEDRRTANARAVELTRERSGQTFKLLKDWPLALTS